MKILLSNENQMVSFFLNMKMKNVEFQKQNTLKILVNMFLHIFKPFPFKFLG